VYVDPELEPFQAMFATLDYTDLAAARAITQVEIDVNALAATAVSRRIQRDKTAALARSLGLAA
jgi:hypothetical protein